MPRLDSETRERIRKLDYSVLQDIVIKLASKEKSVYDFLHINYLDKELAERKLYEETKVDLEIIFRKRHNGFSQQLQIANMLGSCIKRINEFTKISKNRIFEADLLLFILEIPFSMNADMFGTCFTQFDSKVAMIVKRLINVVTKQLHEDYKIEYEETINEYLQILHRTSRHIDTVYNLPKAI